MNPIVRIQLDRVASLLDDHNASLVVTDNAIDSLGDRGYQPEYGARPIKRAIYRNVTQVLAEGIMAGAIQQHSLITMQLAEEVGTVPHNYNLTDSKGIVLNDMLKSCDPAYTFTVFQKQVENNQKADRFSWESDDEDDDGEATSNSHFKRPMKMDKDDETTDSDDMTETTTTSEDEPPQRRSPPPVSNTRGTGSTGTGRSTGTARSSLGRASPKH